MFIESHFINMDAIWMGMSTTYVMRVCSSHAICTYVSGRRNLQASSPSAQLPAGTCEVINPSSCRTLVDRQVTPDTRISPENLEGPS